MNPSRLVAARSPRGRMRKAHSATATRWLNLSASTPWTDLQKMTNALRTRTVRHWRLCQRAKRRRRCWRAPRVPARQAGPARCAQTSIRPRQRLPSQPEDSARSVTYRLRCRDRCHQQQQWQHSWPSGYRCWGCQLPPQARGPAAAAGSGAPVVLSEFGRAAARLTAVESGRTARRLSWSGGELSASAVSRAEKPRTSRRIRTALNLSVK
jgi:hypothetical protein